MEKAKVLAGHDGRLRGLSRLVGSQTLLELFSRQEARLSCLKKY
jgi:hypothetical protein